jgi:hypothetical protein
MAAIENIIATAGFGGLAGSALTFIVTYLRSRKEQRETSARIRAIVKVELTNVSKHFDKVLKLASTIEGVQYFYRDDSTGIKEGERLFESLEYPKLSTDLKFKAFTPELITVLQEVYTTLGLMKASRLVVEKCSFRYNIEDIDAWHNSINDAIKRLDQT